MPTLTNFKCSSEPCNLCKDLFEGGGGGGGLYTKYLRPFVTVAAILHTKEMRKIQNCQILFKFYVLDLLNIPAPAQPNKLGLYRTCLLQYQLLNLTDLYGLKCKLREKVSMKTGPLTPRCFCTFRQHFTRGMCG